MDLYPIIHTKKLGLQIQRPIHFVMAFTLQSSSQLNQQSHHACHLFSLISSLTMQSSSKLNHLQAIPPHMQNSNIFGKSQTLQSREALS